MRTTRWLVLAVLAAAPLRAQETATRDSTAPRAQGTVAPDSTAPPSSLRSFALESQLTVQNFLESGRVSAELGRIWPLGGGGAWLPQLAVALTLLPGNAFLDGLALGPRVAAARTLPIGFILGPRERQLELGVSGLLDGTWRFAGLRERRGTFFDPALRAGIGYRFRGGRDPEYTVLRVLVEGRRHVQGPTFYLSLGLETPRARPRS